jgi:transcriptional regulator with AAA-type ATPase domain
MHSIRCGALRASLIEEFKKTYIQGLLAAHDGKHYPHSAAMQALLVYSWPGNVRELGFILCTLS